MAWARDDMEPLIWTPGQPIPYAVAEHVELSRRVVAHNAPFELAIWNEIMVKRYGWPVLRPDQAFCTMAQSYAMGLPGALEEAAMSLGLSVLKDTEGRALMLRMARPRSKPGVRPVVWWDEADKLARLYAYCQQDVRVERELEKRLLPLSVKERSVWLMDYAINQRGVLVDIPTAEAGVKMSAHVKAQADAEITKITNGKVQTHTALEAMKEWLVDRGIPAEGLAKRDVIELLEQSDLPADVSRVLTLRQEAGKASTAKLAPMIEIAGSDDRVRNIFQIYGAATGRWAGRKLQPHNFPRDVPSAEEVEIVLRLIREGQYEAIDAIYGPPLTVLSRCLRGFFVAPDGKLLLVGDFSAIEGRGVAWFSGEDWKLRAFRASDAGTGPGIYELAYAKAFGVPVSAVKNPSFERQVGKVMELAFGYEGGVGAFHTMGRTMGVTVPDAQADLFKRAWRGAHPMTVATWKALRKAAIAAVRAPGEVFRAGYPGRQVSFKVAGSFLWCLLPSGRCLCYPYPKLLEDDYGPKLTYMTVPSADDRKKGKIIDDASNTPKWARVGTYGGSLMENVIQAICRDLLVESMLTLHYELGAKIVLHVHDEIVVEVPEATAEGARDAMEKVMRTPPSWAPDFPLFATPDVMRRYGK